MGTTNQVLGTFHSTRIFFTTLILAVSFSCLQTERAYALDGIVYIISGGPFDMGESPSDQYSRFLDLVRAQLKKSDVYFARLHNSKQVDVCNDIAQHKESHPEARIVIAGHSYGADAAVWTARCLQDKKIAVDFMLTLDTVPRGSVDDAIIIPENVKFNFHIYQQWDAWIRGSGPNHRGDGSSRGIHAFKQNFGTGGISSHLSVLRHFNDYNIGPKLAAAIILGLDEMAAVQTIQSEWSQYLQEFPAE